LKPLSAATHPPFPGEAPVQRPPVRRSGFALHERELAQIWQGQRFPADALVLPDGRRLAVVYRGRPGRGPGPDFRDAVIALPDQTVLHGDIELHVHSSDFVRHGHHRDPAYTRLAMHVVFFDDGEPIVRPDGGEILTLSLASWVARRAGEIEGWLARPPLWEEPCSRAVARLGPPEARARLVNLGRRRLGQKAFRLSRRIKEEGVEDALYRELLEAAGYGPSREFFRRLAAATSWDQALADPSLVWAAADTLRAYAASPGRPGTGRQARLAGALILIARLERLGYGSIQHAFVAALEWAESGDDLAQSLTVKEAGSTLIGRGRASEIVANVLLPAATALDMAPAQKLSKLLDTLGDPGSYGLTAYLEAILRRQDPALLRGTAVRQGLLLLQQEYCAQGKCGACPLSAP
jgi:Protein of unknown function (DUF2851)